LLKVLKMAQILDGNLVSEHIKNQISVEVEELTKKFGRKPHLAAILVGENGASKTYVNNKIRDCKQVGFKSSLVKLPATISEIRTY
jgi:methylenetetrahydrofolate dehydrogenase (NADP+)/methenyltetrahydrofolate cyclohydrolase